MSVKLRLDFRQQYHLLQSKKMTDKLYTNYISRKHNNEYQHVTEYFAIKGPENPHRKFCKGIESFF